jgi:hypothetical protein
MGKLVKMVHATLCDRVRQLARNDERTDRFLLAALFHTYGVDSARLDFDADFASAAWRISGRFHRWKSDDSASCHCRQGYGAKIFERRGKRYVGPASAVETTDGPGASEGRKQALEDERGAPGLGSFGDGVQVDPISQGPNGMRRGEEQNVVADLC